MGFALWAHGVDHGLRPEAGRELDLAAALADRLGVPFSRTRVEVASGGNLQARARAERRAAVEAARKAAGATLVATAHHADDRAETVLIRLLHGARPDGLAVLPPRDGHFIRPIIRARKEDVLRHLARHEIPFATDPSNQNRRFMRVRVRLEVMPLLTELSPSIVNHLAALADEIAEHAPPDVFSELFPELRNEDGGPPELRRAQRVELRRALDLGQAARIRLSGGREIVVGPKAGDLRSSRLGGQKGGAKSGKSG
jgi:tRNA(Ile)-lysidine synthase